MYFIKVERSSCSIILFFIVGYGVGASPPAIKGKADKALTGKIKEGDTITPALLLPITEKLHQKCKAQNIASDGNGIVTGAKSPQDMADRLFMSLFDVSKRIAFAKKNDQDKIDALQKIAQDEEEIKQVNQQGQIDKKNRRNNIIEMQKRLAPHRHLVVNPKENDQNTNRRHLLRSNSNETVNELKLYKGITTLDVKVGNMIKDFKDRNNKIKLQLQVGEPMKDSHVQSIDNYFRELLSIQRSGSVMDKVDNEVDDQKPSNDKKLKEEVDENQLTTDAAPDSKEKKLKEDVDQNQLTTNAAPDSNEKKLNEEVDQNQNIGDPNEDNGGEVDTTPQIIKTKLLQDDDSHFG